MIYEHEIPKGSKLYFAESAKLKRKIENVASEILQQNGFEEIVTPYLSYHQHLSVSEKELLRFSDGSNQVLSLRGDSTLDVVRIVTKRLGRSTEQKRWFYIQPVFRYPSSEVYQIGGEIMGENDLAVSLKLSLKILETLNAKALLQISNIAIPKILSKMLNLPLEVFKSDNLETLLKQNEPWLSSLATLQYPHQIKNVLNQVPHELKEPLEKIRDLALKSGREDVIVAPLYYAKMRYYEDLFFRFVKDNHTLGLGGNYEFEGLHSCGFGLYTDVLIKYLSKEKK